MRENIGIYRGKRIDTGEWKEGYLHGVQDRLTGKDLFFIVDENNESHRVNPETIGEYTGLTDSDGTGIFEGDLIAPDSNSEPMIVKIEDGIFMAEFANRKEWLFICETTRWKIVGNIYDTPELLGGNDNATD